MNQIFIFNKYYKTIGRQIHLVRETIKDGILCIRNFIKGLAW